MSRKKSNKKPSRKRKSSSNKIRISKAQVLISLSIFTLLVLIAPHLIRFFDYGLIMMGDEPYYHARMASQISEEGIPSEDRFIQGSRQYALNPYHLLLALPSKFFGVENASKAIPFFCGIVSVLLFYLILRELKFDKLNRMAVMLVFIMSPAFIYIFALSTPFCAIIALDLLGFYFFMQKGSKKALLSLAVFSAASFFSIFNLFVILLMTFSYNKSFKKKLNNFYTLASVLILIFFFYYVNIYFKSGIPFHLDYLGLGIIQQMITDLGGILGFSIFGLLLAVVGIVLAWGGKSKFYSAYIAMLAVFLISVFSNQAIVYSNFVVSILAGIALATLIKMKWKLKVIRNISILLLFCGLLFSSVSYTVRIAEAQPNNELIQALDWIRENSNEGDVVFSHYANGFWIESQAQRPVVLDSLSDYSSDFEQRLSDSNAIFSSWDIEKAKKKLSEYDVEFILITNEMYEGLVWEEPEQELAYLLRNSETFKKEYENSYVGVWRYLSNKNG